MSNIRKAIAGLGGVVVGVFLFGVAVSAAILIWVILVNPPSATH